MCQNKFILSNIHSCQTPRELWGFQNKKGELARSRIAKDARGSSISVHGSVYRLQRVNWETTYIQRSIASGRVHNIQILEWRARDL